MSGKSEVDKDIEKEVFRPLGKLFAKPLEKSSWSFTAPSGIMRIA